MSRRPNRRPRLPRLRRQGPVRPVPLVTAARASKAYLHCIKRSDSHKPNLGEPQMTKFLSLAAAFALIAPAALATLSQAALIVA